MDSGCVVEPVVSGSVPDDHPSRKNSLIYTSRRATRCKTEGMAQIMHQLIFGPQCPELHRVIHGVLQNLKPHPNGHNPRRIFFFNEHYIVKPPCNPDSKFAWHTDAGEQLQMLCYTDVHSVPYVSLWCPLDNMTANNGSLVVYRGSHTKSFDPQDVLTQELCTESHSASPSPSPIQLLLPKAGSVVLFASTLWHRSEPNRSQLARRVSAF